MQAAACERYHRSFDALGLQIHLTLLAFGGKHAASYVSRVLQMSRASVYNYLRAAKGEEG